MSKKVLYKSISVVLLVASWEALSLIVGEDFLLASPIQVAKRLFQLPFENGFIQTSFFSLGRIFTGFLLAFVLGLILAVLSSQFQFVEYLLWPYVNVMKAVPVASFIILSLIWFSYEKLTIFIAFLIAFPAIYSNVLQGMKNADAQLLEVASLYQVPFVRRLKYVYLPSVKPFLLSSCNVAVGMAWKAGVAAEVIGIVKGSIGERLYEAKIYFLNADLLSWTVVIICLSIISEKAFVTLIKLIMRRVERT